MQAYNYSAVCVCVCVWCGGGDVALCAPAEDSAGFYLFVASRYNAGGVGGRYNAMDPVTHVWSMTLVNRLAWAFSAVIMCIPPSKGDPPLFC